jgi:hypothetical protein
MKSFVANHLRQIIGRFGFELRPLAPRDLRGKTEHPIAASYVAGRRLCLVDAPLSDSRGLYGFPFSLLHPFMRTAHAYIEGQIRSYEGSPLETYYRHFQPKNAGELFALPGPVSPLQQVPAFAFAWPWESISVQDREQKRLSRIEAENEGRGARLSVSHGYSGYGPVSPEKGRLEFLALARLADSIRHLGYMRNNDIYGDIRAVVLIDETHASRYLVRWGQHRAAVLAALGFDQIPVVIGRPVRIDEVSYWPNVTGGLFTRDQAVLLFKQIFAGNPPSHAVPSTWLAQAAEPSKLLEA